MFKPTRRRLLLAAGVVVLALLLVSGPWLGLKIAAHAHEHQVADAPSADVVIVLGTQVMSTGEPSARLAGRIKTAAQLVGAGRARVILVSGDGQGVSGNEPQTMTKALIAYGVNPQAVVSDPYGLDTYDTCARARQVYGITRALIVTQEYHLARAVTLCRKLGVDVDGVYASCDGCSTGTLAHEQFRDYFAAYKALWDMSTNRKPAVVSAPSSEVKDALAQVP